MDNQGQQKNDDPWAEMSKKYKGKRKERINKAIRAECAGGDEALDRLNDAHKIAARSGWRTADGRETVEATLYRFVLEIVDAMEDSIRDAYSLPERPESGDLYRPGNRRPAKPFSGGTPDGNRM